MLSLRIRLRIRQYAGLRIERAFWDCVLRMRIRISSNPVCHCAAAAALIITA
jgi:hypothetical protein